MEQQQKKSFLQCRKWNSNKISHTKYAIINPAKGFSLTLDDASTYLICYAGIDADNIKNICFSAVISRSSSNTKGGILNIKSEIPQSTLSLEENVLKCTTTVWVRIYVIKLWNSNKVWKKFESYDIPTGNGIEINIPNNTKEIMIFVGCKNAEQVYGGKSYILKTSATIVYEKEIYSATDNLVGTGFYAAYKNNYNKLVMKCKTSNTLFAIVYIK